MKNITESQQAIIDSLISEFSVINERESNQTGLLIDVSGILAEKKKLLKYEEETKIINANAEKFRIDTMRRDMAKLMPDLELLGLGCSMNNHIISIRPKDSSNCITYISYSNAPYESKIIASQHVSTRYSNQISLKLNLKYASVQADSIEAICKHPNFIEILQRNCK